MSIDFIAVLKKHPCISSVDKITDKEQGGCFEFTNQSFCLHAHYNEHDWKLIISISPLFPLQLPTILIENAEAYPAMGHVDWHGVVCYKDTQGLVVDYRNLENVLTGCIYEALRTLHENYADPNKAELQKDFISYWESMPSSGFKTTCVVTPSETAKELVGYRDSKNERKTKAPSCFAIVEQEHEINQYYHLLYALKDKKQEKSIYIPLEKSVMPPSPKQIWMASDILNIFEASVNNYVKDSVIEIIKKQKWSDHFTIILSHPKPITGHILWGVEFHRKEKSQHPFLDPKDDWIVSPMQLRIHSKEYLLDRCGNSIALDNKKVAIIGCGSVGGVIALQLAKSGVGELHLIDPEIMEIENIYRHVLGATAINEVTKGYYKSEFLKWQIETNIPYVNVASSQQTLFQIGAIKKIFDYFDAIVIATGDFSSELHFNSIHKNLSTLIPVIYAWQDGFGIGGHAICVVNDGSAGCLECLYTKSFGFEPHAKTSFIKYGQTISKHLGGCSGVFTPFSFLDASQTALLATRMTLEALHGKTKNEIRSWKGNDEQLKTEGHSASNWYEKCPENLIQDKEKYIACNCSVCGKND